MRFKVYVLRNRGRPIPPRHVRSEPALVGQLTTYFATLNGVPYHVATFKPENPMEGPLIPDLYEPVLIGMSTLGFRLRGYERVEDRGGALGVVQEWSCEPP